MKQKVKLVSKKLTLKELEHQLWMAAHIITGPIDASDYKTYIFPILFFKRINDVYNEEFETAMELYGDEELANAAEQHRIQIPKGCRWSDVLSTTKDVGKALQGAFRCVEKANPHLYGIFGGCCQTNEAKHQYSFDGFSYEVTKERHSVRAASRLSLNVLRFESDLCELNRL